MALCTDLTLTGFSMVAKIYTLIIYEHRSNTNDSFQVPVVSKLARLKTALSVYEVWVSFFFLNIN